MEEVGIKLIRDIDGNKLCSIIVGDFSIGTSLFEKISIAKNEVTKTFIVWLDSRTKLDIDFIRFVYDGLVHTRYAKICTDDGITSKLNDWLHEVE